MYSPPLSLTVALCCVCVFVRAWVFSLPLDSAHPALARDACGRVSFSGALSKEALSPLGKPRPEMELPYEKGGWRVGVTPMATNIQREFITRNLLRSNKEE